MYAYHRAEQQRQLHPAHGLADLNGQPSPVPGRPRAPGHGHGDRPRLLHRHLLQRLEVCERRSAGRHLRSHVDGLHPRRHAGPATPRTSAKTPSTTPTTWTRRRSFSQRPGLQKASPIPTTGRTSRPSAPPSRSRSRSSSSSTAISASRSRSDPLDYNLGYLPNFVTKRGQHEGILDLPRRRDLAEPTDFYVWRYYSKSGATSGAIFGDIGSGGGEGDPKVDDFIDKAKAEFDAAKNAAILGDLQRYLAGMQYCVSSPGVASGFELAWPAVKNYAHLPGRQPRHQQLLLHLVAGPDQGAACLEWTQEGR